MSVAAVIPAAGVGKRMQEAFPGVPKVLIPVAGRAMVAHVVDSVLCVSAVGEVVVVIAPGTERQFAEALQGMPVTFAYQDQPRGTGDAVMCGVRRLTREWSDVLVLYADQPLIRTSTLARLVEVHEQRRALVSLLTVDMSSSKDSDRELFIDWGRVIRGESGKVARIVELKDASPEERAVAEFNPSVYCMNRAWLKPALGRLEPTNAQGEYYFTDVVEMAAAVDGVVSVRCESPMETLGANTPEQLVQLEQVWRSRAGQ